MAHNERLDQILVEQKKKGESYADWQKKQYPVKASHTATRDFVMSRSVTRRLEIQKGEEQNGR